MWEHETFSNLHYFHMNLPFDHSSIWMFVPLPFTWTCPLENCLFPGEISRPLWKLVAIVFGLYLCHITNRRGDGIVLLNLRAHGIFWIFWIFCFLHQYWNHCRTLFYLSVGGDVTVSWSFWGSQGECRIRFYAVPCNNPVRVSVVVRVGYLSCLMYMSSLHVEMFL